MQTRLGVIHALASGLIASLFCLACAERVPASSLKVEEAKECLPGYDVACTCPGGATSKALCGSNGKIGICNCAVMAGAAGPAASSGAVVGPVGTGTAAIGGTAGSFAAGAAGIAPGAAGSASAPAVAAGQVNGCAPGETCRTSSTGVFKFCSADPAATLPPPCSVANLACGTNSSGTCLDATSAGFAGSLFCVHSGC